MLKISGALDELQEKKLPFYNKNKIINLKKTYQFDRVP